MEPICNTKYCVKIFERTKVCEDKTGCLYSLSWIEKLWDTKTLLNFDILLENWKNIRQRLRISLKFLICLLTFYYTRGISFRFMFRYRKGVKTSIKGFPSLLLLVHISFRFFSFFKGGVVLVAKLVTPSVKEKYVLFFFLLKIWQNLIKP